MPSLERDVGGEVKIKKVIKNRLDYDWYKKIRVMVKVMGFLTL